MSRLELEQKRRENFNLLDMGFRPKVNAVEINVNNTYEHELGKFNLVWEMRGSSAAKHLWERPSIVTEARFSNRLRADVFVLDTGTVYEIAHTETEAQLRIKKRIYMDMGLKFEVIRV